MSNVGEGPREAPGHPTHPNRRKSEVAATAGDQREGGGGEETGERNAGQKAGALPSYLDLNDLKEA